MGVFVGDIFKTEKEKLVQKYIKYYFNSIVGYKGEIYSAKHNVLKNSYVSIIKDDINRLDLESGGSGVLRQRIWSIFIFSFITKEKYIELFGTNIEAKPIQSPYDYQSFEYFEYMRFTKKYTGKYPLEPYISRDILFLLQNYIFNKLRESDKTLFINTYVYSCIGILDSNIVEIDRKKFNTYYYNTNYKFVQNQYPSIIQQNRDINTTSYMVDDVKSELESINNSNRDLIDLVDAYCGKLALTPVTENNYKSIVKDIENKEHYIITEGLARTGKTVIAMRLLNKYPEANLLLMNYFFYTSLKSAFISSNIKFPDNRIFHHDLKENNNGGWSKGILTNNKFLIIDEAQRLGIIPGFQGRFKYFPEFNEVKQVIEVVNHKHTIFLGDNLQKLNPIYDKGIDFVTEFLKNKQFDYKKYYFNLSVGIPPNILEAIRFILYSNQFSSPKDIGNYEINTYSNPEDFIKAYKLDKTIKKHMTTIYMERGNYYSFEEFKHLDIREYKNFPFFLDKDIKERFILTPYQLISRELDSIYIFLPSSVIFSKNQIIMNEKQHLTEYLINQIYVLMTRARLSLNIYCENKDLLKHITERVNLLKSSILNDPPNVELSDVELKKKELLESKINEKGITRLIHFTSIDNIESIMKNGILSIKDLRKKGLDYDYNDSQRLDNNEDGICLSIQNPNRYLLNKFKKEHPGKKYKILVINPCILYEILNEENTALAKRFYCNYNAASKYTSRSMDDIEIMYQEQVEHFNWNTNQSWYEKRFNKEKNQPTSIQAEILFFESIPSKYIEDIRDEE